MEIEPAKLKSIELQSTDVIGDIKTDWFRSQPTDCFCFDRYRYNPLQKKYVLHCPSTVEKHVGVPSGSTRRVRIPGKEHWAEVKSPIYINFPPHCGKHLTILNHKRVERREKKKEYMYIPIQLSLHSETTSEEGLVENWDIATIYY